jgi:hypothetical protein
MTEVDKVYYNFNIFYIEKDLLGNCSAEKQYTDDVILEKASDWYLSVVRFDLPISSAPLFIPDIKPFPNVDINETIYSVTITQAVGSPLPERVFVQYETSRPNSVIPSPPTAEKRFIPRSEYYYIYTYSRFLSFINTALEAAYTNHPSNTGQTPPRIELNESAQRFKLILNSDFVTDGIGGSNHLQLWFNNPLYTFFEGFDVIYYGRKQADGLDVRVISPPVGGNTEVIQDYPSLSTWNCVRSLQLRSLSLNVNNEYLPTALDQTTAQSSTVPIIADFIPLVSNSPGSSVARQNIIFTLNSAYKLINMLSDAPLTKFSLSLFFTDELGNAYPINLNYRELVSVKLLFHRKSTFQG